MVNVVFVLAPGVHLLDVAGPAQVFSTVGSVGGDEAWNLRYVAETTSVDSHQGLALKAETDWPALVPADLVVVPGWWIGDHARVRQPFRSPMLERIAAHHDAGGEVISVCAGAFALAEAGLLDDRRATTHHDVQEQLAALHPRVRVVRDVLYVSDDRVHTSAGIASGTDLALHRVSERLGPHVA
ncbi:MAG TPA: AraC family transcriptional regulator, partial [Mycobacterium sp.]